METPIRIKFMGANRTVTGSKTALFAGSDLDDRIMIDAGMFQGPKQLRLRNWEKLPVDAISIGAIVITHAHIDHCGYLPRMVKEGFSGPVYCSKATADLMNILLIDAAHLQEEEAQFANKHKFSKHSPALPLFNTEDALAALRLLKPVPLHEKFSIGKHFTLSFHDAGHILGASMVRVEITKGKEKTSILFSGDIGRYGVPILNDPENPETPDYLVMESTYGDRLHTRQDIREALADVVNKSYERNGVLLIPAFAIGRTQLLLYLLKELKSSGAIPDIPIYVDSPMAIRAIRTYVSHPESMDTETQFLRNTGSHPCHPQQLHICSSTDESKALNRIRRHAIIISASGMATGGRILHHLRLRLPEPNHTLLFIGYQGVGTRGRAILEGKEKVKMHGEYIPVKCHVEYIDGFSAHADRDEMFIWLKKFPGFPKRVFVIHGEPHANEALSEMIKSNFNGDVVVPEYLDEHTL